MSKFRKKPVVIEAAQWFKNGDHPLDYSRTHDGFENDQLRQFSPQERKDKGWEGDIVRYYRNPSLDGQSECKHCGDILDVFPGHFEPSGFARDLPKGCQLHSARVDMRGFCPKCARS